jgi:hypothetical protein
MRTRCHCFVTQRTSRHTKACLGEKLRMRNKKYADVTAVFRSVMFDRQRCANTGASGCTMKMLKIE